MINSYMIRFSNFAKVVYIGAENGFYRLFEIDGIYESCKKDDNLRLYSLYQAIMKYIL